MSFQRAFRRRGRPRYSVSHQFAATLNESIIGMIGGASVRPWVYLVSVGSDNNTSDRQLRYALTRASSGAMIGNTLTAQRLDLLTSASHFDTSSELAGPNWVLQPSVGDVLVNLPMGGRQSVQWQAEDGNEVAGDLSSGLGLALNCKALSSGNPNVNAVIHWFEDVDAGIG